MNPTPVNQVLLAIDKPLQDSITTDSGVKLFLADGYDKEWKASVTATIEKLPTKFNKEEGKIIAQLSEGDEVAISYRVVADFEFDSDNLRFMSTTEDNDYVREFVNGKGEWVKVYAIKGKIAPIWIGVYQDRNRNVISGVQGSESEMERWLSQFPIGKTDVYRFNNFFQHEKKDYWKCYADDIFAKKVKGHWVAVSDRVLCRPIDEEVPAEILPHIQHTSSVKIRRQDRARVISGGKRVGLKKDDVIQFNPLFLEKYTFGEKEYYLIKEKYVLGKWQ